MLETFTLSNGIRVATYHLPDLKSFHIRATTKGGFIVENKTNNGVAHFMEHMLVQGIPSYPNVEEFSSYIESLAGNYGAYTDNLLIGFHLTVPFTHAEDAVKITSEVCFSPLFVEDAIEKERRAIHSELTQKMDSHWYKISQFFRHSRFQENHPLSLDSEDALRVLHSLTREDLISFWKKYFVPQNTYLLISGNFEKQSLKQLLENYFSSQKSTKPFSGFPVLRKQDFSDKKVVIRFDKNLGTSYIDVTFPSLNLHTKWEDRVKQNVLLTILGQLRNSRLFKLLRYQKGLVYDVGSGASIYPNLGYVYISSQVAKEHLNEAIELIIQELKSYTENGPTQDELDFVRNYLINQWLMAFDHPSSIAGWVEGHLLWDTKIRMLDEYISMVKSITLRDLQTIIHDYWDFSKVQLLIQGQLPNTNPNREKYQQLLQKLGK